MDEEETEFSTAISPQDNEPIMTDPSRFCGRYVGTTIAGAAFQTTDVSICCKYHTTNMITYLHKYL